MTLVITPPITHLSHFTYVELSSGSFHLELSGRMQTCLEMRREIPSSTLHHYHIKEFFYTGLYTRHSIFSSVVWYQVNIQRQNGLHCNTIVMIVTIVDQKGRGLHAFVQASVLLAYLLTFCLNCFFKT